MKLDIIMASSSSNPKVVQGLTVDLDPDLEKEAFIKRMETIFRDPFSCLFTTDEDKVVCRLCDTEGSNVKIRRHLSRCRGYETKLHLELFQQHISDVVSIVTNENNMSAADVDDENINGEKKSVDWSALVSQGIICGM